jgi:acyl transferase domain-containing protein
MCAVLGEGVSNLVSVLPDIALELDIANLNADRQIVVSDPLEAFAALHPVADQCDWEIVRLKVSGAFHSRLMEPAAREFVEFLATIEFSPHTVPVISNVTALPFPEASDAIRQALTQALTSPARWADSIRFAPSCGCSKFLETGPDNVLSRLVDRISWPSAATEPSYPAIIQI